MTRRRRRSPLNRECVTHAVVVLVLVWPISSCLRAGQIKTLRAAARQGDLDAIKGLVAKGADINTKDPNGQTALQVAVRNKQQDTAEWPIDQGAGLNDRDEDGWPPLRYAVARG